jgi:hypothetical protein
MLERAHADFDRLILAEPIVKVLERQPFDVGVSRSILDRLNVLQSLCQETASDGSLSKEGIEIHQQFFVGEKAQFSDESDRNKNDFRNEMTFRDPITGTDLFCPWLGKVKKGQFRIHFEWPRPQGQPQIKVLYIGPKITKT